MTWEEYKAMKNKNSSATIAQNETKTSKNSIEGMSWEEYKQKRAEQRKEEERQEEERRKQQEQRRQQKEIDQQKTTQALPTVSYAPVTTTILPTVKNDKQNMSLSTNAVDVLKSGKLKNENQQKISNVAKNTGKVLSNLGIGVGNAILQVPKMINVATDNSRRDQINTINKVIDQDIEFLNKKGKTRQAETLENVKLQNDLIYNNDSNQYIQKIIDKQNAKIQQNVEETTNPIAEKLAELSGGAGTTITGGIISAFNPALGTAFFTTSAAGGYYDEALARGMDKDQAQLYAGIMGSMEGVTESVISAERIKGAKAILEGVGFKNAVKSFGLEVGENFLQEAVMPSISEVAALSVGGKGTLKYDFSTSKGLEDLLKDSWQDGIDGALSAILIGGVTRGSAKCIQVVSNMNNGLKPSKSQIEQAVKEAQDIGVDTQSILKDEITHQAEKRLTKEIETLPTVNSENTYSNKLKESAIKEINNSNIEQSEKKMMLDALDKVSEVTDADIQAIKQAISLSEESKQLDTKGNYKDNQERRQKYMQYKNDSNAYNSTVVNEVLDTIPQNRNGRRTVKQWLQAADEIGKRIANLSDEEIEKIAYKSWFDIQPSKSITQYDRQAKQQVGFQKFTSDEWINTINKAVNEARANDEVQETTSQELPVVDEKKAVSTEVPTNLVESAKQQGFKYKDMNLEQVQKALDNKGIKSRFDVAEFSSENEGAKWKLTRNDDGTVTREIILNPKANEETVIQEMAIHELTHDIISKNTDTSIKLYKEVKQWLEKDTDYQEQLGNLKEIYGEDLAEEEAIAKTLQTKFGNQEEINRLVNYNPSMARRIYDWVVDKLNKITGGKIEKLYWEDVRNKFERAYNEEGNYSKSSERFDIREDEKLGRYWNVEDSKDIFKGLTKTKDLQNEAYKYILNGNDNFEYITDKIDNKQVRFARISAQEYVYGRNAKDLNKEQYNQKMRTAPSIDDLINNADITYHSPLTHKSSLFKDGFNNYQGKVGIDNNIFQYIVRVGKAQNDNLFYDLSLEYLGNKNGTEIKVPGVKNTSLIKNSVPNNSITSSKQNVNTTDYNMQKSQNNTQDNQGRTLSKQQQEYFKNSKATNENGQLEVVYHGTNKAGFTEFNRNWNYYTNNKETAQSYTGGTEMVDTKRLESISDAKSWLKGITDELYIEGNNVYDYDGEKILSYDNSDTLLKNLKRDIQREVGDTNAGGTYQGYVNIEKPITIDAHNEVWSKIALDNIEIEGIDNIKEFLEKYGSSVWKESGKLRTSTNDIVAAISDAIDNGDLDVDGVIIKNIYDEGGYGNTTPTEAGTDYITFKSNQFKALDNFSPTSNQDIRYSISTDGKIQDSNGKNITLEAESNNDNKTLLAIHNLTEEKLKGILELGGFPVPSIAVTNQAHTNFGEISVIFNKNTINPETNKANKVYSRDAYTTRTPTVVNEINTEGIKQVSENTGIEEWNLRENYKEITIEDAVEKLKRNEKIMDKYLNEKDISVEPVYRDFKGFTHLSQNTLQDFINNHKELMDTTYTGKYDYSTYEKYYKDVHDLFVNDLVNAEKGKITKQQAESFYKDYPGFNHWDYFIRDLIEVQKLQGKQQLDEYATQNAKEKAIDIDSKEYRDFVKNLISPMYGEKYVRNNKNYYTDLGNPRSFSQRYDPYTLDNIVKIMNENKGTGQESTWGVGVTEIAGDASKRFKSIEDIKNNENLLVTQNEEEHKQMIDKYNKEFRDIEGSILDKYSDSNIDEYVWREKSIEDAMKNIARKIATGKKADIQTTISQFKNNGITINEEQAQRTIELIKNLSTLPTNYFEAKPQRAVGFDEIDAIVIPNDVSNEIKQQLKDLGINTIEYDRNNENERANIVKSLNEYKFSKSQLNFDQYLESRIAKKGKRTTLGELRSTYNTAPTADNKLATSEYTKEQAAQGKFRKHYDSIMKSQYTTAEAKAISKELMGSDTYIPETNNEQLRIADERIRRAGLDSELNSLMSRAMTGGNIKSVDIAVGERLIQYYSKTGNKAKLQEAIQATAMAGTSAGQTVQAMSLLNHQTPEGQAIWLQRSVDRMNNQLRKTRGENADQFKLTPEMTEKIVNSQNTEELYKNLDEVYRELGQQVTKSTIQKIDAWRYFSMLANPKTHIRNIVGNVAMGKVQGIKNKVAGAIEDVISKTNPEMERTHTLKAASKEVKNFAKNDISNVVDRLELNENKYNPKTRLENSMRTFKSDAMENTLGSLFEVNNKALEVEDGWGLKAGYAKALSEYMTANKLNPDTITDAQLAKARNYAIEQAKEATFHQASALATALNQFSNKNKVTKFLTDATIPFKKTPINVAKAGIEYSPVGLAKSAIYDTVQLRKGNITVNQYIDNISKGLTGTGIALLGYALSSAGVLRADGDDDDKETFERERGKQKYSVRIGDKTYSLDWLAPAGIPLFIGAKAQELMQQSKEKNSSSSDDESAYSRAIETATSILDAFTNAVDPMTEMSMLSGLSSTLKSYDNNLFAGMAVNMGKSYVNQFVPTAVGQVAKTTDKYERDTTSTKTGTLPKAIDLTKNQIMSKIPGLRQQLPTKTNVWGEPLEQNKNVIMRGLENAVFPWTKKDIRTNNVDKELVKLYDDTGEKAVLPSSVNKNLTIDKQKYVMTSTEYAKYKKLYGDTSYKLLNSMINSSSYKNLNNEQKQKAIDSVYDYAKEQIKIDYAKQNKLDYEPSTLTTTVDAIQKAGGNASNYFEFTALTQGMSKESEKINVLTDSNYSTSTKKAIYENTLGKDDSKYGVVKNTNININEYLKYKAQNFSADKQDDGTINGKTISGSKKEKVRSYIDSMNITYMQKLLLYGMEYTLPDNEQEQIANYINSLNLSRSEKTEMLSKFQGFTIYKDGSYKY